MAEHERDVDLHPRRMAEIETELEDLRTAERVFAKLTQENGEVDADRLSAATAAAGSYGKPAGIPSVPDMIEEALEHGRDMGAAGLRPAGLVSYIRGKYWPGAETSDVGPIAWRMWKRGDLRTTTGGYALHKSEPETENDGPISDRFVEGEEEAA